MWRERVKCEGGRKKQVDGARGVEKSCHEHGNIVGPQYAPGGRETLNKCTGGTQGYDGSKNSGPGTQKCPSTRLEDTSILTILRSRENKINFLTVPADLMTSRGSLEPSRSEECPRCNTDEPL